LDIVDPRSYARLLARGGLSVTTVESISTLRELCDNQRFVRCDRVVAALKCRLADHINVVTTGGGPTIPTMNDSKKP
jgi:hypothetical protein